MPWLLLIPAFLVLCVYVLVVALCVAAGRADRRIEGFRRLTK